MVLSAASAAPGAAASGSSCVRMRAQWTTSTPMSTPLAMPFTSLASMGLYTARCRTWCPYTDSRSSPAAAPTLAPSTAACGRCERQAAAVRRPAGRGAPRRRAACRRGSGRGRRARRAGKWRRRGRRRRWSRLALAHPRSRCPAASPPTPGGGRNAKPLSLARPRRQGRGIRTVAGATAIGCADGRRPLSPASALQGATAAPTAHEFDALRSPRVMPRRSDSLSAATAAETEPSASAKPATRDWRPRGQRMRLDCAR